MMARHAATLVDAAAPDRSRNRAGARAGALLLPRDDRGDARVLSRSSAHRRERRDRRAGDRPFARRRRARRCGAISASATTSATARWSSRIPPTPSRGSRAAGIRIAKLQLSSALRLPTVGADTERTLAAFDDGVYLHQVVERRNGAITRHVDLAPAFAALRAGNGGRRVARALPRSGVPGGRRAIPLDAADAEGGARLHEVRLRRAASRGRDLHVGCPAAGAAAGSAAPMRSRARCTGCSRSLRR